GFLFILCIFFIKSIFAVEPVNSNKLFVLDLNTTTSELSISPNYQQFKVQLLNTEITDMHDFSALRRKKKSDNLMLYVAGGIAVATLTLILTNNPENFTSNSASGVNLGIAAGGTIASGMIVAKFFLDKKR
ncbi:MAG TPA: hypothetical protein P5132_09530, partial [Bacteroidales bacterium]|nr:hypothetical protein [Bacteroidales bacterium]